MHPDHAIGTTGLRGQRGDRDRAGITRQDDAGGRHLVQGVEDPLFELLILGNGFDDDFRRRCGGEVGGDLDTVQRRVSGRLIEAPFLDLAIHVLLDRRQGVLEKVLADVEEDHFETALSEDMGDTVAHRSRADDCSPRHRSSLWPLRRSSLGKRGPKDPGDGHDEDERCEQPALRPEGSSREQVRAELTEIVGGGVVLEPAYGPIE